MRLIIVAIIFLCCGFESSFSGGQQSYRAETSVYKEGYNSFKSTMSYLKTRGFDFKIESLPNFGEVGRITYHEVTNIEVHDITFKMPKDVTVTFSRVEGTHFKMSATKPVTIEGLGGMAKVRFTELNFNLDLQNGRFRMGQNNLKDVSGGMSGFAFILSRVDYTGNLY